MEDINLKIEKLIYEGVGLSHFDNKAVFVKGGITGELVKVKIVSKNKNYLKAEIVEIVEPSKHRIKPKCPMSKPCGGCNLDYIEYDYLIKEKENIVKEIFQKFENVKFKPFAKSPKTEEYRHKSQYPVTETKKSKRLIAGYYKERTHEIVNIKYCPIQPSVIDKIIDYIRENWNLSAYIEKSHKGLLRHINTRISNSTGEILVCLVLNSDIKEFEKIKPEIEEFSEKLINNFIRVKGFFVNLNNDKTNRITGDTTILIKGQNYITEKLGQNSYNIGVNSFFQVNPKCAEILFDEAKKLISKKGSFLDLYGGVGTIGIFMKDVVSKITLVEENKEAIICAKENYKLNNVQKYEVFEGSANSIIKNFIKEKRKFENIVIDPPRKGSDVETLDNISKMTDSIIYISCNPMTLKRDAEILIQKGFKFKSVQGFDMFPNTYHIECVAHFKKDIKN